MATKRQEKFSRMVQKELAGIFQLHGHSWFSNNIVSITKVEMSPDLSLAKVYLSFLMKEGKKEAFDRLNHNKSEIRKYLGNQIRKAVRKIPEIAFFLDEGAEHAEKMDEIFRNLHIPPEDTDNSEE